MTADRLRQQLDFVLEIDRLKGVGRQSYVLDGARKENSAEHSWHVAMMALVLSEHAPEAVDLVRVLRMLLVHDLVEIDAGDAYFYDSAANEVKPEREKEAAARIFGLLPPEQAETLRQAWEEFEACETSEARFAKSLDRLMPLLHNIHTKGRSWQEHGIRRHQVAERLLPELAHANPTFHQLASDMIENAVRQGWLAE
jgi:putative hydrolase of HD superfamily